jgi:hypothetical protein
LEHLPFSKKYNPCVARDAWDLPISITYAKKLRLAYGRKLKPISVS